MQLIDVILRGALLYLVPTIFATVFISIAIAWGIRLGGLWLITAIHNDPQLEDWLKRIFNNANK